MLINLLSILSQDGKEETLIIPIEMESFRNGRNKYVISKKEDLHVKLVNKGNKQVDLTGSTSLSVLIPCGRCLEPVEIPFDIEFEYEIDMKQTDEERRENLDEMSWLNGLEIDVEKLAYNEILLNWPIRVLCKDDCQGICSHCGVNLNKQTCDCDTSELDPRMAAIKDIFSKFKEV